MPRRLPSLLSRLRRHRGLWVVVALVLLFKLGSSSVCLGDAPVSAVAGGTDVVAVTAVSSSPTTPDIGSCLLGEAECHCVCAHALPVPVAVPALAALQRPAVTVMPAADGLRIAAIDLPLRPPIA